MNKSNGTMEFRVSKPIYQANAESLWNNHVIYPGLTVSAGREPFLSLGCGPIKCIMCSDTVSNIWHDFSIPST